LALHLASSGDTGAVASAACNGQLRGATTYTPSASVRTRPEMESARAKGGSMVRVGRA
jgi:hypothetical protein